MGDCRGRGGDKHYRAGAAVGAGPGGGGAEERNGAWARRQGGRGAGTRLESGVSSTLVTTVIPHSHSRTP